MVHFSPFSVRRRPGRARRRRPWPRPATTRRACAKMFCRWRATVCSLITSAVAISRFVRPVATSRSTSHSRSVSANRRARPGRARPARARSGRAPSRSNVARAASSSRSAASLVAERPAAQRDLDPGARRVVGHLERRATPRTARRSAASAAGGVAVGEQDRAGRVVGDGPQQRGVDGVGDLGELVARRPGGVDVAGGEQHLDGGREHGRTGEPAAALLEHAPDRPRRPRRRPLGQPEQREAGRRLPALLAGRPVGALGVVELAAQPVQLALLVEGEPERRVAGSDEPSPRPLRLGHRLGPRAVAPAGPATGAPGTAPGTAPGRAGPRTSVQRLGPLRGPSQVEHVHAGLDHRAVDDPGRRSATPRRS